MKKPALFAWGGVVAAGAIATAVATGTLDLGAIKWPLEQADPEVRDAAESPDPVSEQTAAVAVPEPVPSPDADVVGPTAPRALDGPEGAPLVADLRAPGFDLVRVDPTGLTLVAGRAMPSAGIEILVNSAVMAETMAGQDGKFVSFLDLAPDPEARILSLRQTVGDSVMLSEDEVILAGRPAPAVGLTGQPDAEAERDMAQVVVDQPAAEGEDRPDQSGTESAPDAEPQPDRADADGQPAERAAASSNADVVKADDPVVALEAVPDLPGETATDPLDIDAPDFTSPDERAIARLADPVADADAEPGIVTVPAPQPGLVQAPEASGENLPDTTVISDTVRDVSIAAGPEQHAAPDRPGGAPAEAGLADPEPVLEDPAVAADGSAEERIAVTETRKDTGPDADPLPTARPSLSQNTPEWRADAGRDQAGAAAGPTFDSPDTADNPQRAEVNPPLPEPSEALRQAPEGTVDAPGLPVAQARAPDGPDIPDRLAQAALTARLGEGDTQSRPTAPPVQAGTPIPEPVVEPPVLRRSPQGVEVLQVPPLAPGDVALDAISYDAEGEVLLSGRGSEDAFVRIYLDNNPISTSAVDSDGRWRVTLPQVDTGTYTLRVDQIGQAGEVSSRVESPFLRESASVLEAALDRDRVLQSVTVQPGNTLWAIAKGRYGDGLDYVKVFDANRDRIRDPDLIYPGQIFDLPSE